MSNSHIDTTVHYLRLKPFAAAAKRSRPVAHGKTKHSLLGRVRNNSSLSMSSESSAPPLANRDGVASTVGNSHFRTTRGTLLSRQNCYGSTWWYCPCHPVLDPVKWHITCCLSANTKMPVVPTQFFFHFVRVFPMGRCHRTGVMRIGRISLLPVSPAQSICTSTVL